MAIVQPATLRDWFVLYKLRPAVRDSIRIELCRGDTDIKAGQRVAATGIGSFAQ